METSQTAAGQQSAFAYLRHGQTPFFRLPSAAVDEAGEPAYADADAVLLGVPWDGGTPVQAGARLGPYHVRRASAFVQTFHPFHRLDVFAALRAVDGGNVAFPPSQPAVVRAQVEAEVARIAGLLAADLVSEPRPAVRVVVKVRYAPFFTQTHGRALAAPATAAVPIEEAALAALDQFHGRRPVRLLGVRAEFAK